jgi:2-oxoisovalerate dehydrogenase E1 component alpha subunit
MDDILLNAQRQGRISFYLTCRGEEAMTIGSASALRDSDVLLSQYREQGLFMWRGFTLDQFTNQVRRDEIFLFLYHAFLCCRADLCPSFL